MTAAFGLSCDQELKIEPLLHDEESVSKPLLRFASLSTDAKQEVMLKIKLAARRQIRSLLTPDQQKLLDQDVQQLIEAAKKGANGAGKKAGKGAGATGDAASAKTDPLSDEEALSRAVMNYAALLPEEKKAILLQVKRAARSDSTLELTPGQAQKLDTEIKELTEGGKPPAGR